jgi:hypothetical protein
MTFWQRTLILRCGGVGLTLNSQALEQAYYCYLLVSYINTPLLAPVMQSVAVEWRTDNE